MKEIINYTGDDFPFISSIKKFKAIFSLRSEYVGDVDYWGLQHNYIPDLKNNRYFLKPLTPQGASAVITQPYGFPNISVADCESLIVGCSGNDEYVKANIPCVPASVLSIICHELYDLNEYARSNLLKRLNEDKDAVVEEVLENYYIKTLATSGITNEHDRDAFENALVDDKGNRKRVGTNHKDLSALTKVQIDQLIHTNMLRIVSIVKNNDDSVKEFIVELPHDRFCGFIMNHKNKRFEEIQARNNNLKEWLLFGVLGLIIGVVIWYIHNVFIDTLEPFVSDFLRFYRTKETEKEGVNNVVLFISYVFQNIGRYEVLAIICILLSAILTPCSILSFVKLRKKTALCLSICGAIISAWLIIRAESPFDGDIGSFALLSLILSIGIILYIVIRWNRITKSEISSWPLWGGWFIFFSFLFWEFLSSLKIGISDPSDSWYFIILLPILLLTWTWTYFKLNIHKEGYLRSLWGVVLQGCFILGLLGILAFNNMLEYDHEFKLDMFTIYIIFIVTIGTIFCLLWNITSLYKRIVAIVINVVALIVVYILNLGYNPIAINYKNVYSVCNWRIVDVKDLNTNLLGVCDPISGDTIMPCVYSYNEENKIWELKSYKFKNNPILNGESRTSDGAFVWEDGVAEGLLGCQPTLEEYIRKIERKYSDKDTLLSSHINYYSTQLYKEIRSASLEYIVDAKPYSLDDIKSLMILDSLQNVALKAELKKWNPEIKDIELKNRDRIDAIVDDDIHMLLSVITQNMYLYILKDRIQQKDFPSVFTLLRYQYILYFSSVPGFSSTHSLISNLNTNINGKTSTLSIGSSIHSNDIINEKCFAWYNLFISLCSSDNSYNAQLFVDRLSNKDKIKEYTKELSGIVDEQKDLNNKTENVISELGKNKDVEFGLKSLAGLLKDRKTINDKIKSTTSNIDVTLEKRKIIDEDIAFNRFSKEVLDTLFYILEKKPYNIYNGLFEDICEFLISTRNLRGYNVDSENKRFTEINNTRYEYYNSIMNIESEVSEMLEAQQEQINKYIEALNKILI